jgi:hypothetical protein
MAATLCFCGASANAGAQKNAVPSGVSVRVRPQVPNKWKINLDGSGLRLESGWYVKSVWGSTPQSSAKI